MVLGFFDAHSVQDIIFNNVKITDIDFFDISTSSEDTINTIRQNVAGWYVGIRNIAAVVLVMIVIYVGIRMAISTVAEEKAKYKQMLIDWFTSMCLLFLLHFIIVITITVNKTLVTAIGDASSASTSDIAASFADAALKTPRFSVGMSNAICYTLLEALTFAFLIAYIKRMITIAFLIIIAPLVTITYSIDKMGDGKSQALNMWFKEFAYNILIQPFHCVAYLALCSVALASASGGGLKGGVLAICLLAFLAKSAEDIVKRIFGFDAPSMASPVVAAALGYSLAEKTAKFAQNIGNKASSKTSKIPEEEATTANGNVQTRAAELNSQHSANADDMSNSMGLRAAIRAINANGGNAGYGASGGNGTSGRNGTSGVGANRQNNRAQNNQQRKLSGQGKKGRIIRGVARGIIEANKLAFTVGTGIALGASQGDLNKTLMGASLGLDIGQSWNKRTKEKISGSHYRAKTARAFNNYQAKTGLSDEEVTKKGMALLKGDVDPQNEDDLEFRRALVEMTNYFREDGKNEADSYKATKGVMDDVTSGIQGEETEIEKFTGSVKGAANFVVDGADTVLSGAASKVYEKKAESYAEQAQSANTETEKEEYSHKAEDAKIASSRWKARKPIKENLYKVRDKYRSSSWNFGKPNAQDQNGGEHGNGGTDGTQGHGGFGKI